MISGAIALGTTWRRMIRRSLAPSAAGRRDVVLVSDRRIVDARTTRVIVIQPSATSASVTVHSVRSGNVLRITIAPTRNGQAEEHVRQPRRSGASTHAAVVAGERAEHERERRGAERWSITPITIDGRAP